MSQGRVRRGHAGEVDPAKLSALSRVLYPDAPRLEPMPPGADCLWVEHDDEISACAALGMSQEMRDAPGETGWIGHYEARDAEAGSAVLREGARLLTERGAWRVLGPLNGNTWRRYRVALESRPDDPLRDPPFFAGEPRNPFAYADHFTSAGFTLAASYESRIVEVAAGRTPHSELPPGIRLRPFEVERFSEEMTRIYELSLEAFADNAYYSPIGREAFFALYEPIRPLLDPNLVLLAEDESGALVGYLFSYPDPTQSAPRRLIAKTLAVARRSRGLGLGSHLLAEIGARAADLGYGEVMHALMHVDNRSTHLSGRQRAQLYRRYALYQWGR